MIDDTFLFKKLTACPLILPYFFTEQYFVGNYTVGWFYYENIFIL